ANSPYPSVSPSVSRPNSPSRAPVAPTPSSSLSAATRLDPDSGTAAPQPAASLAAATSHILRANTPPGPFTSTSHLPTFYPPPPAQWTFTNGTRHPLRPKPPRQGEIIYTRWIPSLGQYLSFRVVSLSAQACVYRGPTAGTAPGPEAAAGLGHTVPREGSLLPPGRESLLRATQGMSVSEPAVPTIRGLSLQDDAGGGGGGGGGRGRAGEDPASMTDTELLHKWMNEPRVAHSWGEGGPAAHQAEFLKHGLTSRHSFPVIGCFDGQPFGFFEIYWVKEDPLAGLLGSGGAGDWDRGLHVLVGEQAFRGAHRVRVWLSALVHYCWLADLRTEVVMMEPRVDNAKLKAYCEEVGFYKEREVAFPHKQSNLMKLRREAWTAPAL
ncbi:hypothetical protein LTR53_014427, partial [Teratosphaeriaceae sp. CCFEE 6253]